MKNSRKYISVFTSTVLFSCWLIFVYRSLEQGNFSTPVLWALVAAIVASFFSVRELKKEIKESGELKPDVVKKMRKYAEIFSLLALFCGAGTLIQIADSIGHQQPSKMISRIAKAASESASILDEGRCNKLPWTQMACKKAQTDLMQLFFEISNDKKSEASINRIIESVKYQYKTLSDEKTSIFRIEEFKSIIEVLDSNKTDPISASYNKLYLGLITFVLAFLAATRKVALSLV